jgi:AcrR family transcriptional regulator
MGTAHSTVRAVKRRTQAERREETRGRLLEAAVLVFARRGYYAAGVAEIAAEAGCSTGALYDHFGSKEKLFLAVMETQVEPWMRSYSEQVEAAGTPAARLEAGVAQWDKLVRKFPEAWLLLVELWSVCVRDPALRSKFAAQYDRLRTASGELLGISGPGSASSQFTSEQLGTIGMALVDGFALQRIADPATADPELLLAVLRLVIEPGSSRDG